MMNANRSLIRSLNLLLMIAVTVFSLMFGVVIFQIASSSMIKQRNDSLLYISKMIAMRLEELDSGVDQMRSMLISNQHIRNFLAWEDSKDNAKFAQIAQQADIFINDVYEAARLSSPCYSGVGLYKDGKLALVRTDSRYYFSESLTMPKGVESLLNNGVRMAKMMRHLDDENRDMFSTFRIAYSPTSLQPIGIIEIALNVEAMMETLTVADVDNIQIYIITPDIGLLWREPKTEAFENLIYETYLAGKSNFTFSRVQYQLYRYPTETVFGDIVLIDSSRRNIANSFALLGYSIAFVIFSTVIMTIVTSSLAKRIMRPIQKLTQVVDVSGSELSAENEKSLHELQALNNEIGVLSHSFKRYIEKTKEYTESLKSIYNDQKRLELELLLSQIKPHFLYNTMESICGMAKLGYNDELYTIAKEMGIFYRISLSKGEYLITVSNELRHVESYLRIEQIRKRNSFTFSIDVEDKIAPVKVLKVTLQPIVENSVQHGLRDVRSGGSIEISATRAFDETIGQDVLSFVIADNGKGMDDAALERLNQSIASPSEESAHGFGILNVNERIKLYYGRRYGVTYQSKPGHGCTATVIIPLNSHTKLDDSSEHGK